MRGNTTLTASPQIFVKSQKLAPYLTFLNTQIAEFAVCQCVTEALVLQQKKTHLGGAEGQWLISQLNPLDLVESAGSSGRAYLAVLYGQLT